MAYPRRELCRSLVRILLGVLLCTAGILKLRGDHPLPIPNSGQLAAPHFESWIVAFELVLGLWLLSGLLPKVSWLVAGITFVTFAGVSAYAGLTGVADCGCFGPVKTSPWLAFGVDIAAIALLGMFIPTYTRADLQRIALGGLKGSIAVAIILTVMISGVVVWAGSVSAGLARLRGEQLSAQDYLDFGSGAPGTSFVATSALFNWSDRPVRIFGGTSDCSCTTTDDLPLTIPPGERREVRIRLTVPAAESGRLTRTVLLRTDCEGQRRVKIRVSCLIE